MALKWDKLIDTPYFLAGNGYLSQLKEYYERCSEGKKYSRQESLIFNALRSNNLDLIKYIIEELNYDYHSYGCYAYSRIVFSSFDLLSIAANNSSLEIVKYIESLKNNNNNSNNYNNRVNIGWDYVSAFTLSPNICFEAIQYFYSKLKEDDSLYNQVDENDIVDSIYNSILFGRIDMVEWFLNSEFNKRFNVGLYHVDIIKAAIQYGKLENILYCLNGVDNYQELLNKNLIYEAAQYGHLDIVKWLHSNNIDTIDISAIEVASKNHFWDVEKYLLENIESWEHPQIIGQEVSFGQLELVSLMIKKGPINTRSVLYGLSCVNCDEIVYFDMVKLLHKHDLFREFREDFINPAAAVGRLDVMQWLHDNRTEDRNTLIFSTANSLDIIKWIHENRTFEECTANSFDYKSLEVLKWLHENRTEGCTTSAMDEAARKGRLDIVQWLHENRTEGCTTVAMDQAAAFDHLDVLKWLHENRTEGCTTNAMAQACRSGNLEVIKWLHENRTEGCLTHAMENAVLMGHNNIVKWLHENRTEGCTTRAMDLAAEYGNFDLIVWLHENRTEGCTTKAMDRAAGNGNLKILQWLHENRTEGCTNDIMYWAAASGILQIVQWLNENLTESWNMEECIEASAEYPKVVQYLQSIQPQQNLNKDIFVEVTE